MVELLGAICQWGLYDEFFTVGYKEDPRENRHLLPLAPVCNEYNADR